jgi:hypothetical protein
LTRCGGGRALPELACKFAALGPPESARVHGAVSLVAWVMVLIAGRMIAYL